MRKTLHVVCLGGGNAMSTAVLEGLKKHPVKISAVSSMLDSGGSAGRDRKLFHTKVSFGDLRRAALALSGVPTGQKELFRYRFANGTTLANAYCTANASAMGIETLLEDIKEDLRIADQYQVLPVTLDDAVLCAELDNGEMVREESNIDIPKHNSNLKIKRVFLDPEARAYRPALKAIEKADLLVLGPGDLYSSLFQILLVKGISEAIKKSNSFKVYVCNLMTKLGETNDFSVLHFTSEVEKYLGQEVDRVIFNKEQCSSSRMASYKKDHPELLAMVGFSDALNKNKFIGRDLLLETGPIIHDSAKLVKTILSLCPRQ